MGHLGSLVRAKRLEMGLKSKDVAAEIKKSTAWQTDVEKGNILPGKFALRLKLSKILQLDVAEVEAAFFGDKFSSPQGVQDTFYMNVAAELSMQLDAKEETSPVLRKAPGLSYQRIERRAEALLKSVFRFEYDEGLAIPVGEALEDTNWAQEFSYWDKGESGGMESFSDPFALAFNARCVDEDVEACTKYDVDAETVEISMSPDVGRMLKQGGQRARFTAAHEIGHAVLHHDMLIRHNAKANRARPAKFVDVLGKAAASVPEGVKAYESPEWQANAFAAALLMPLRSVQTFLRKNPGGPEGFDIEGLAQHFQVSELAASIRVNKVLPRLLG